MNTDRLIAESIAKEYVHYHHWRVPALKKLDRRAKRSAVWISILWGSCMLIAWVIGLTMALNAAASNVSYMSIIGISVCMLGQLGMGFTYLIYCKIAELGKRKYAFEIIEIAKEICGETD